ncbi:MAG: DUF4465 domain-containing protein [Paludibacter sp.]|nr:DUF4465 domain-containing protein [Paludibacter sp.]
MKKTTFIALCMAFLSLNASSQHSEKITKVLEYKPAPGQHINRLFPTPSFSDTPENALLFAQQKLIGNTSMLGLGAFGGYAVVGFDHSIVNVTNEYDFKALGNAFTNSSEPGVVMVCQDLNKNGLPDANEPWYELAGSEYNNTETIHNYEITYYRPDPDGLKSNIKWTDNQGAEGVVTHISFATQATMYPLWITDNTMTFKGTRLRKNALQNGSMWSLPGFNWGYVDNYANTSTNDKIGFKIDWAVDDSGNPVHLDYIDFIKVYTGIVQETGWLGETSTEFAGIVDLHPDATEAVYPPIGEDYITLDLQNTTTLASTPLAADSHWSEAYSENVFLESQNFIFSHRNGWGGYYWDGFTISNHISNDDFGQGDSNDWIDNQWECMAKGGFNGEGSNFLVGNWGFFNDETAANVTETSNYVKFNDGKTYKAIGAYVSNSAWPYYSCKYGDTFARKFVQGDYFKLIATGYLADGITETGTAEYYLADYRSENSVQMKLNNSWEWMDLSSLGEVSYIQFTMESTDTGDYGMNTAAYFCLDKLTVEKVNNSATSNNDNIVPKAYRSGNKIFNLTNGDYIEIYRINGTLLYQGSIISSEMNIPANELFIIKIHSKEGIQYIR